MITTTDTTAKSHQKTELEEDGWKFRSGSAQCTSLPVIPHV